MKGKEKFIEKLKKLNESDEDYKSLDGAKVSMMHFVAGLAQACAEDEVYSSLREEHPWFEPFMLRIAFDAFNNAIEIQEALEK